VRLRGRSPQYRRQLAEFVCGNLLFVLCHEIAVQPWLRVHIPLIEPDVRIGRVLLSDKSSRLHPRHVVPKPAQAHEPKVPVEVRPALASPDFVLDAQPLAPTAQRCSDRSSGTLW
jgi:hypothetical protein